MSNLRPDELIRRRDVAEAAVRAAGLAGLRFLRDRNLAASIGTEGRSPGATRLAAPGLESVRAVVRGAFPDEPIFEKEGPESLARLQSHPSRCWLVALLNEGLIESQAFPLFGPTVAFLLDGKPVAAAVLLPQLNETIVAAEGLGATLNGRTLKVAEPRPLDRSIVVGGNLGVAARDVGEMISRLAGWRLPSINDPLGLMCSLASGRIDAFTSSADRSGPWDLAAGRLIVQEAGGILATEAGPEFDLRAAVIFGASHGALLDELRQGSGARRS